MSELQKVNTDVFINLRDRTEHIIVSANRGDAHSRTIRFHFTHEGELYELPEGTVARFLGTRPDGAGIIEEAPCTITGNQVLYEMTPYVLNIPGDVRAKIELRNDDTGQILTTVSFLIHIPPDPFDENTIIKTDEFSVLNQLITTIEKAVDDVHEALTKVEQTVDEANQAIQTIYETNETMQEVISDAHTVIGDMEQKLLETDEKVAGWQTDIETTIDHAEQAVADTIAKGEQDFADTISKGEQDFASTISKAEQDFADTISKAEQDFADSISKADQDVSGLVSQLETVISQAEETMTEATTAIAEAVTAAAEANQATAAATAATTEAMTAAEQAELAAERAIAAAKSVEEASNDSPFIIQAEEPPGNTKKTWINSNTHVMSYYDGTAWVKLASIWS